MHSHSPADRRSPALIPMLVAEAFALVVVLTWPAHSATFAVTSAADAGTGSFREAIALANEATGRDTVLFAIPGVGPHTIQPQSSFGLIVDPVVIDGYSQPGASPATESEPAVLMIEIDGSQIGDLAYGVLQVYTDSCLVKGMAINRFVESGIQIVPSVGVGKHNVVEGCYLGTDIEGILDLGNGFAGVEIYGADSNLVGGTEAAARNILSGNVWGVHVWGNRNVVSGNLIGTDVSGTVDIGNQYSGVFVNFGWENTVGGTIPGSRNTISGNGYCGVYVHDSDKTVIVGNHIGTDVLGQSCIGNEVSGISLLSSRDDTIGGLSEGSGNLISCNTVGVIVDQSWRSVLLGNRIGTNATGSAALHNAGSGVEIISSADVAIGGAATGGRNVISGNGLDGISVDGSDHTIIRGNYVGCDASGLSRLANERNGILLSDARYASVGGVSAGEGNVISGNGADGIRCVASAGYGAYGTIQGNLIGTGVSGVCVVRNAGAGISIQPSAHYYNIGGTAPSAGNIIAGNKTNGIEIVTPLGHVYVKGNSIGLGAAQHPLPNGGHGVYIAGSTSPNTIGGTEAGSANTIACNDSAGVCVVEASDNLILANSIHSNGLLGIDIGNDGWTPNCPDDAVQDYPLLTEATSSFGITKVAGVLSGEPGTQYRLEFYSSTLPDSTAYGEGEQFLGSVSVSPDATGEARFVASIAVPLEAGQYVSATATDLSHATSEFSRVSFVSVLTGSIGAGELELSWTPVPSASAYWVYGAANQAFFSAGLLPPHEHRLDVLPPNTATWASDNGVGSTDENWTYLIVTTDAQGTVVSQTNRFGEFDAEILYGSPGQP